MILAHLKDIEIYKGISNDMIGFADKILRDNPVRGGIKQVFIAGGV